MRTFGWQKDGESVWWQVVSRNKRSIVLKLSEPDDQDVFARLAQESDIVLESFRPGTLERWNLPYERLAEGTRPLLSS